MDLEKCEKYTNCFKQSSALASTEDDLQKSVHKLKLIADKYSLDISINKSKVMDFIGNDPVPSKICINDQILERVNEFTVVISASNYLFLEESDISDEIVKFNKPIGIFSSVMKPSLVQRHTRVCLFNILA